MPSKDFRLPQAIMYSIGQHFLSTCCVPGTVSGYDDTSVNKRIPDSGPQGVTTPAGKRYNCKLNKEVHYTVCLCRKINIPGSYVSTHLVSKKLIVSCSGFFFQGCLCSKQPWKLEVVSLLPWREAYFLSSLVKLLSPLEQRTGILSIMNDSTS